MFLLIWYVGVIAIMAAIATQLKLADVHCFLIPCLKPFLITDIIEITEPNLLEALKAPVSIPYSCKYRYRISTTNR